MALDQLYRPGYAYQKAGVQLEEIIPAALRQATLFDNPAQLARSTALMHTLDAINRRMGRGTLRLLGEAIDQRWKTKSERQTPRYTTRLAEVPVARAG